EGLAEGEGFEPSIRFPVYTLSKRAPSATRPPLQTRKPRLLVPVANPPVSGLGQMIAARHHGTRIRLAAPSPLGRSWRRRPAFSTHTWAGLTAGPKDFRP